MQAFKNYFKALLNSFLESNCPLCERPSSNLLCKYCTKQLDKCTIPQPSSLWQKPLPVFAWGKYGGALKRAIAAMKYDNHPEIAILLGQLLGESWLLHTPSPEHKPILVPIPLHPHKQKQRGFNQAALIAKGFCEITGLKVKAKGLKRVRETEAQHSLSSSNRSKNLAGAFSIGQDLYKIPRQPVLLIDDIYTTGATAKSAIQTLRDSQISVLGIAACAAALKTD
ncbi:MAG: ComF family protein [Mastigocoleus sp. MO_167.B18]|uniref:ComF family protein n=1 Tax=Mastigocoleus sp. MO_188.B34 TaxID=3036635 RepID=UPI002634F6BE|nr:ComF family protein [Mastigocoleus sp. MO_188.B34]MDJ0697580.1 ComF family protein [Mastigocoleus sp. MO_188.B34]MDJ0775669.1 ComF family protein [Mastigocoleus sp. MO_167.B18]